MAPTAQLKACAQVVQDVASQLTAGRHDSLPALHEPATVHTVCPAADPTSEHGVRLRAFYPSLICTCPVFGSRYIDFPSDREAIAWRERPTFETSKLVAQ